MLIEDYHYFKKPYPEQNSEFIQNSLIFFAKNTPGQ